MIRVADRLNHIEEYYFSKKLREVKKLELDGRPIINMGCLLYTSPSPRD